MTIDYLQNIISQGESEILEFKQSFNKSAIETLVAFSNTRGGKLLIGEDNRGNIKGITITEETIQKWINEIKQNTEPSIIPDTEVIQLRDKTVVVLKVNEFPIKPVSYKNRYYKRRVNSNHLMSLSEVSNEYLRTINSSWDYYIDDAHKISDLDLNKIDIFIRKYEEKHNTKVNFPSIEFLNKKNKL